MVRSRRRTSHGKEIYYILCILFIVGFALFTIFGRVGYLELKKARLELETHRDRVNALKQENQQRLQTIQQLKSDKGTLEKYAREKGYGKEGEIVQQVPEEQAPPKTPPPARK